MTRVTAKSCYVTNVHGRYVIFYGSVVLFILDQCQTSYQNYITTYMVIKQLIEGHMATPGVTRNRLVHDSALQCTCAHNLKQLHWCVVWPDCACTRALHLLSDRSTVPGDSDLARELYCTLSRLARQTFTIK